MARNIPLNGGLFAIVDDADYELLKIYKWTKSTGGYVRRNKSARRLNLCLKNKNLTDGKAELVLMHHQIIGKPQDGFVVDHINGNKLDNRRENLRFCTNGQNAINQQVHKDSKSGYKGVRWDANKNLWSVRIKNKIVGRYPNIDQAALAYNEKAKEVFGEYARLNVIE